MFKFVLAMMVAVLCSTKVKSERNSNDYYENGLLQNYDSEYENSEDMDNYGTNFYFENMQGYGYDLSDGQYNQGFHVFVFLFLRTFKTSFYCTCCTNHIHTKYKLFSFFFCDFFWLCHVGLYCKIYKIICAP